LRCTTLVAALALTSASVETRAAPPESAAATTVRIVVDASALNDDSGYFETEIKKQLSEGLTAEGFEVVERGGSTVRIKLDYFDEQDRDFLITTDVVREGRMAVSQKPTKCPACVDDELVEAAVAILPEVIEVLRMDPQHLPTEGSNDPPAGDGDGDGDVEQSPTVAPLGPMGAVGIGIAALGVGAVVWSAVDLSRGKVYDQGADADQPLRTWTDYTPRGRVWLGVGIGGVAVGGALLITDLVIRSKKRKQHEKPSGALVPLMPARGVGLGWVQRF